MDNALSCASKSTEEWCPSPKQAAFLAAYRLCGNITKAAGIAEINPNTPRANWYADPGFERAMAEAGDEAIEHLEEEARRRAFDGVDEPVFYKGSPCGVVRKYSDTLLIFLLKAAKPAKYRDAYEQNKQPVKATATATKTTTEYTIEFDHGG